MLIYEIPKLPENSTVKSRALKVLKENLPMSTVLEITALYKKDGVDWYSPYHFFWGMGIRNLFRENGILDNELPTCNWDDYYGDMLNDFILDFMKSVEERPENV